MSQAIEAIIFAALLYGACRACYQQGIEVGVNRMMERMGRLK